MKLIKKITAAVTAMAMAASMMSIGASAFSWTLYNNPQAGAYGIKHSTTTDVPSTQTMTHFYDRCKVFQQNTNSNGVEAYVQYWAYCKDNNGNFIHSCTSSSSPFEYHDTHISQIRNLTTYCEYYYTLVIKHVLINNGLTSYMEGTTTYNLDTNP